jgi:hypothetical protein
VRKIVFSLRGLSVVRIIIMIIIFLLIAHLDSGSGGRCGILAKRGGLEGVSGPSV